MGDCSIAKRTTVGIIGSEMFEKENWKRLCVFQQSMAGFSAWELIREEEEERRAEEEELEEKIILERLHI